MDQFQGGPSESNSLARQDPDGATRIATAGEALIDLIARPDGRFDACLGGAVFNLTRAIARQGVGVCYLNPLSGDRFGRQLALALVQDGVALAEPEPVSQVSSLAVVAVDGAGHPDYAFYRQGVADRATSADRLGRHCAGLGALRMVCTGALALAADDAGTYLPWLAGQRAAARTIVVDANLRPSAMADPAVYRANVHAALQLADIIKVSDEDLELLGIPGADPLQRARALLHSGSARLLALTLGPAGACLLARDGRCWQAAEAAPVTVVDTVGAGDCFLAGVLVAALRRSPANCEWLDHLDDELARHLLAHALASATLCVLRHGADPPNWGAVCERVARQPCRFA